MKKRTRPIILVAILSMIWAISCSYNPDSGNGNTAVDLNEAGEELMLTNCVTCHNPSGGANDRIAPPMFAVKKHYADGAVEFQDFKENMIRFMKEPTNENSKMPGAVQKFGLMPKLGYTEQQMNDVAEYIFYTDFEKPGWFDKHYEEEHGDVSAEKNVGSADFKSRGLGHAMATKAVLGRNLMGQITANGPEEALRFCNEKAIQLTDSMANEQSVSIRRVSDKPRNPRNRASAQEAAYILSQKKNLANGVKAEPTTFVVDGRSVGYFPIMTNGMCLQCHGDIAEDIKPKVQERIKELYPADEAVGYVENELRGIWVVESDKKANTLE